MQAGAARDSYRCLAFPRTAVDEERPHTAGSEQPGFVDVELRLRLESVEVVPLSTKVGTDRCGDLIKPYFCQYGEDDGNGKQSDEKPPVVALR